MNFYLLRFEKSISLYFIITLHRIARQASDVLLPNTTVLTNTITTKVATADTVTMETNIMVAVVVVATGNIKVVILITSITKQ